MKIFDISTLEPKEVMKWFQSISLIPHGSYHEKEISDWTADVCRKAGAEVIHYPSGMILAKVAATPGYENAPVVMLQSHLDMVLAKAAKIKKDLTKEHIDIFYDTETGLVKADGTSLGADDGLGVASMLAVLHDKTIKHGPLELVFSVNEEDDPGQCIKDMKPEDLKATYYINLDGDNVDSLIYGGAGCTTVKFNEPINYVKVPEGYETWHVSVDGLIGGHSGIHIHKPHVNAICFLCEALTNFMTEFKTKIGIVNISGGPINNAIPLTCSADIQIDKKLAPEFEPYLIKCVELARKVAQGRETKIWVTTINIKDTDKTIPFDLSKRILQIGSLCHNKMFTAKSDFACMFSSSNLGFMKTDGDHISWDFKVRSFLDEEVFRVALKHVQLMELLGFKNYIYQGTLSAFINDLTSNNAARIWHECHRKVTNRILNQSACPGGLESASFCKVNPSMLQNTIVVNATVLNEHSAQEAFVVKDLVEFWKILKLVLENIK